MKLKSTVFFSAMAGLFASSCAYAAHEQSVDVTQLPAISANSISASFGLSAQNALQEVSSLPVKNGESLVRMRQTYRGVPVYGQVVTVIKDGQGRALRASGRVLQGIDADLPSVKPRLSEQQAMARWKASHPDVAKASLEQSKLYVYFNTDGRAQWMYHLSYYVGGKQPHRPTALVDADHGTVIREWDGLTRDNASAVGPGGNEKAGFYQYGVDRPAMVVTQSGSTCQMYNSAVATFDMHQQDDVTKAVLWNFTCPTSQGDAINGAASPINDAHYFATVVYNMYAEWFQTPPLADRMNLLVHYLDGFEGAHWAGGNMYFGDGGANLYPVVALDVTSHEVSHGFTEQRSGLEYENQSGGMNEAFSDMAGEAAKFYDRGDNDFVVGWDVVKRGSVYGDAFRYMCTPNRDGYSIEHAKDYVEGMDPHYSSGVYNKAFCLLATSPGWNTRKAFEVFTYANAAYWGPTETFDSGACGVENAATLYGYNRKDVIDAFDEVGVTCSSGS
ncbi:elastase [Dyella mobilis]|nr:elastase [Dyella mobilis]